jgi:hypothetical protein
MTFGQSLNAFADRALATTLGAVDAGACVVSNGQRCFCLSVVGTPCWHLGRYTQFQISCNGRCVENPNACC